MLILYTLQLYSLACVLKDLKTTQLIFIKQPLVLTCTCCAYTSKFKKLLGMSRPQFSTEDFKSICFSAGHKVQATSFSMLQSCPPAVLAYCTAASASPSQYRVKETHASQLKTFAGHCKSSKVQRNSSSRVTVSHLHPTYTLLFQICSPFTLRTITSLLCGKASFPPQVKNKQIYE